MFLAAVARPRFDDDGVCTFDGKIGIWPFVERVAAKRSSKLREKGTIETKPVNVKKDNYLRMIVDNVLPAIWQRWPTTSTGSSSTRVNSSRVLHLQHDNAPVHFTHENAEWKAASTMDGWKIGLKNQCPNSPDTNICDLGFFRTLQTEQWKLPCAKNVDELIDRVHQAFHSLAPESIDANFLTLQRCLDEIIQCHGSNDYKIPHLGKQKLRVIGGGKLPESLHVSDTAKKVI
jgi:hypothetical protein